MKTYSSEAATPAAAITLATANSNTQPILFTNHFGDKGTYENTEGQTTNVELKWVIRDITVTLTRDWDISQAQIVLTCELPDKSMREPNLPDVSIFRGGDSPYLGKEDEIRIYAGYVESSTTPITADLLDEVPFDYIDIKTQKLQSHNRDKPLCPIFWGFIDTMEYSSTPTGSMLTIQCRDRVRVLADTRIVSLVAFQGKQNSEANQTTVGSETVDSSSVESIVSGDRSEILLQLANAAAGNPYGENRQSLVEPKCWKFVEKGEIVKGFTVDQDKNVKQEFPQANPAQWVQTTTCRIMADKATPRFNIWVERPPIVKGEPNSTLQVLNKVPLEIVDFIAKTEERPMDFFASHINGDFILGPRVKDESGFADPDRSYRTYFHRTYPKECSPPTYNQMIQKIKVTDTTLFSFNNFVIIDSSKTKGGGTSLIGAIRKGYSALSTSLTNRNPSPPCKTQIIYDGGLASYENPEFGATLLALAHAKIWSRDITGIEMEVVGDPTFYPSEAIRVYNTYLHDYKTYTVVDSNKDTTQDIRDYRKQAEQVAAEIKTETQDQRKDTSPNNNLSKAIGDYFANRIPSNIDNFVLPYYSVRVVQHRLTTQGDKGYVTKVLGVSDI